ncbi:MAG: hypothetical protein AAF725_25415, partial [Acidobacteriota bacterium]
MSHIPRRIVQASALAALCAAIGLSCSPGARERRLPGGQLIGVDEFSESRLSLDGGTLHLDFRTLDQRDGFVVGGATYAFEPEGLVIRPVARDPLVVFDPSAVRFDQIEITMASRASGLLQVFWADGETP